MRGVRAKLAAITVVAALAVLGSSPGFADTQVLYRASASGAAVHGFYDHKGLFPVPLVNLSAAYTEATLEPGPTTSSLGSFLWDPEAAELRTILCVLSEERFCEFPEYPFQARASHPSAGPEPEPPRIEIGDADAPVQARAAYEEAEASAGGAAAAATVTGFDAIPMGARQEAAASSLALALAGGPLALPEETGPWLLSLRKATGSSTTGLDALGASAASESELKAVSLLGGLITFSAVTGSATASMGARAEARASSSVGDVKVGDLEARLSRDGLRIDDPGLGQQEAATLNRALDQALGSIGLHISRGHEETRETDRRATAEAYAFSLDFERQIVPDQAPEGTSGRDVLRVPFGLAVAEAEVAQIVAEAEPPPPAPQGGSGAPAPAAGEGAPGLPRSRAAATPPVPTTAPQTVAAEHRLTSSNLGIPAVAVATALLASLLMATALTWLKVNEVLTE